MEPKEDVADGPCIGESLSDAPLVCANAEVAGQEVDGRASSGGGGANGNSGIMCWVLPAASEEIFSFLNSSGRLAEMRDR